MISPASFAVLALKDLQKSMMLTPCGPRAVPTGGAGVAWPAFSWTLTSAAIFFFLGGMGFLCSGGCCGSDSRAPGNAGGGTAARVGTSPADCGDVQMLL